MATGSFKLTERELVATLKDNASTLITQLEGTQGSEIESLRRMKFGDLMASLRRLGLLKDADAFPAASASGSMVSITDGAEGMPVKALTVDIASEAGVTGATLTRYGRNLLKWPALDSTSRYGIEAAITGDGKLDISGTATNNASTFYDTSRLDSYDTMPLGPFPAGTYSITAKGFVGDAVEDRITATVKTADGTTIINTKISAKAGKAADGTGRVVTFTTTEPFKVFLWVYIKAGSTIDSQVELQMEYGIGLGAWEACNRETWTFDWSDSAGAITSGTLDAVAGKLMTDGQTYDVTPAKVLTLPGVNAIYADCGDVSVTYRGSPVDQASVQTRRMALCVSTYRDNFRTDASEYYLAVSYDGRSFYELRASRGFAGDGLVSSDVQPLELNDGLLMICTAFHKNAGDGDTQPTYDFKASFTRDFKLYVSAAVDLGFMDAAFEGEPYVWAPQIVRLDGKYYCIASISTGATVDGDAYTEAGDINHRTRYLRPYYIEVEISADSGRLSIEPADGATLKPLKIHADDQDASIMDVSLFYSETRHKLCAVYKDRIYNIVNMAESDTGTIDGTFTDVYTYLGNMAYMEAGYFTRIGGNEYIYLCNYLSRPIVLRHALYPYYTTKDMIHGWEEVGSVNSGHSFGDGVDAGMRNPYPIELSEKLMRRLLAAYAVPSIIPDYAVKRSETAASMSIVTRISDVIYKAFDKYTEYRSKAYIPSSSKKDGVNCDMCFLNDPATVEIASDGVTTIRTPNGNATVTKSTTDADVFMVTHGAIIKGVRNYVD